MKPEKAMRTVIAGAVIGSGLLLGACGGGDGGNGNTSISGTAATGAAMTSGTVTLTCGNSVTPTASISTTGTWNTTVPTVSLPCAVQATDGTNTYYSFTVGNGSSIVTNVTPLTTLALAQVLGAAPSAIFAANGTLSATDLAKLTSSAIDSAIANLNNVLAAYALPANFNPVTTPLTAATGSTAGNDYDRLLDQFGAANPDLDTLVNDTVTNGTIATPATPSYTAGATTAAGFFTTFAGDYTLKVTQSGAEGSSNNATVTTLFPVDSARVVHIKSNGDVSIDAVGRTLTYAASTYDGTIGAPKNGKWTEFDGGASLNTLRYRSGNGTNDLYLTYNAANGQLEVDPQGFVNTVGYATLKGSAYVPATSNDGDPGDGNTPTPPTITSIAPASGAVGDTVTITGTGFSTTKANNVVRFSSNTTGPAPQAEVVSATATQLVVKVPAGAVSGGLTVYSTEAEAVASSENFTVTTAGGGTDTPPAATTAAGKLAAAIGAGLSGTYNLTCPDSTSRTITINPDGSSLIDNVPLVGGASGASGRIEVMAANTNTGKYYVSIEGTESGGLSLYFANDNTPDTSTSWNIRRASDSVYQYCTLVSGPTARLDRLAALKLLAPVSTNLNCAYDRADATNESDLPTGVEAFNLAADGSLTLGGKVSASTTETALASLKVSFAGYSTMHWENAYTYLPVYASTVKRYVDIQFSGEENALQKVRYIGANGSTATCTP